MTEKKFPARLHIIIARESSLALVIRRGPSKYTCVIGWNREDDSFEVGQWLKGRIYERRSDLSPDGKYFIYFAMNGKWDSEVKGSWSAISRTPYLKAISLWAKGDCWNGGGLFTTNKSFWLNDGYGQEALEESNELERDANFPGIKMYNNECLGVYYNRLQRDGWESKSIKENESVFEKNVNEDWILRKIAYATSSLDRSEGKGCYYDEHQLYNK